MAVRKKTKQEQAAIRKATLERKETARRNKAIEEAKISVEDDAEATVNEDEESTADVDAQVVNTEDEGSRNTPEHDGTDKRKSLDSATGTASISSPQKRKQLRKWIADKKKRKKAGVDDDGSSYSGTESDKKPAALPRSSPRRPLLTELRRARKEGNSEDDDSSSDEHEGRKLEPDALRAALIETEERLERAERQVRTISRTRLTDTFLEGQVQTWTKETLWKMCKFITNDGTMHKVMQKASKHFKVDTGEQQHWMATYSHIVRDGLNQKRNACAQDLRKTIKSK
jgi:hypothetical protein